MEASPDTKRRAATLLGRGASVKEAAAAVGYSERQLRRWLREPRLAELARRTREESLDPDAHAVLRELLASRNEAVRLRAAIALLQNPALDDTGGQELPEGAIVVFPMAEGG